MKSQNENVSRRQIDKGAYVEAQREIADHRHQGTTKGKKNELIEPLNLLSLCPIMGRFHSGIDNVVVHRPQCGGQSGFHGGYQGN